MGGDHHFYHNGTHWRIDKYGDKKLLGLSSYSDKNTFPPTNWTVWDKFEQKWIPDDDIKIMTGAEIIKYPCQKVVISFDPYDKDFNKIHKDTFGNYTPTNAFQYGRPQYVSQNQDDELFVFGFGQWETYRSRISSAAAGDMNPASQRNKWCNKCSYHIGDKLTSWTYEDDEYDRIPSDKIKVSCENMEEDGFGDWHNAAILHESAKRGCNVKGLKINMWGNDYDIDNVPIWVKVGIC